jgi:hypothetical protein
LRAILQIRFSRASTPADLATPARSR